MNGYKAIADCYRRKIESGEIEETEALVRKLKALEFVAGCDQSDLYQLMDTSAFNFIIIRYVKEALKRANVSEKTSNAVMDKLTDLLNDSIFNLEF